MGPSAAAVATQGTPPAVTLLVVRINPLPQVPLCWSLRSNVFQIHFSTTASDYLKRTVVHASVCLKKQKTCACVSGVQEKSLPRWKGLELMLEAAILSSQHTWRWGQVRSGAVGVLSRRKAK